MSHDTGTVPTEFAHDPAPGGERVPAADHDTRLELSRRIDWRFLLPDPRLGSVACIGCDDVTLRNALREFTSSVTFIPHNVQQSPPGALFDGVIVCGAGVQTIDAAVSLVQPGGFLYVEVVRSVLQPANWARMPGSTLRKCEHLGLRNIRAHWHWPSFEECNAILPIDDGGASARFFFDQQGSGIAQQLKSAAGRALLASGLLESFVGSYSVLAERPKP